MIEKVTLTDRTPISWRTKINPLWWLVPQDGAAQMNLPTRIFMIESTLKRRVCVALTLLPFSIYYPIKLALRHIWDIWASAALCCKRR